MAAARGAQAPKWLLIVGQCGDGKTTLINALLAPGAPRAPQRKSARGDTKEIQVYQGRPLSDGTPVLLLDTPGVGDMDVPPMKLVAMIEAALKSQEQSTVGGIDGVIVTQEVRCPRVLLGAQVVLELVQRGVVGGPEKWNNVILVGTKVDTASQEHQDFFKEQVVPLFFTHSNGVGPHVMVHQGDVEPLREAIRQLPNVKVRYQAPPDEEMARALAGMMGIKNTAGAAADIQAFREMFQAQSEQFARVMDFLTTSHAESQAEMRDRAEKMQQSQERAQQLQREMAQAALVQEEARRKDLLQQHQASMQMMQKMQEEMKRQQDANNDMMMQSNQMLTQAIAASGSGGGGGGCSIL